MLSGKSGKGSLVVQNNLELLDGWQLLATKSEDMQGVNSIPLDVFEQFRVSIGLFYPEKEPALIFEFNDLTSLSMSSKIELEGLSFYKSTVLKSDNYNQVFVLKKCFKQDISVFNTICLDLLAFARHSSSMSSSKYFVSLISRVNVWIQFLKNNGKALSIRKQAGLLAELLFLEKIKNSCPNENTWLNCWRGPEKHCHDFVTAGLAYEIKAQLTDDSVINISNIEQLDNSETGKLILVVFELSESNEAYISLNSIVAQLISKIKCEKNLKKFIKKLEASGYFITGQNHYNVSFLISNIHAFEVNSNFPRLIRSNVSDDIINLKYKLNIANLNDFKVALDKTLKEGF